MYISPCIQPQETDQTILLNTAENGNTEIVELLIGRGADMHITDKVW
jgi:ankyrin repeat protein